MKSKILFSKAEKDRIFQMLRWRIDECDSYLSDSSLSDSYRIQVEIVKDFWSGILFKLNLVLDVEL